MIKVNLIIGNITVICKSYDESTRMAKPFVEKGVPISIKPISKTIDKVKEEI